MNQTIVCKFGGSSVADADCFRRVRDIVRSDPRRRYIVVSAPGRRTPDDSKVTDLLYRCHALSRAGADHAAAFAAVQERFFSIAGTLGLHTDLQGELHRIERLLPRNEAYAASRGEYLCAKLLADCLEMPFIDAVEVICFRRDGSLDLQGTELALRQAFSRWHSAVIPGFYGALPDGEVCTFSRGGSDITGAIVARAAEASLYENWTDVPGFLAADPHLVAQPPCASALSYAQMRLLARAGAGVLHPDSILPVADARIPTQLKNTFAPNMPGTRISDDVSADICCLSGRTDYTRIEFQKPRSAEYGCASCPIHPPMSPAHPQADFFVSTGDSFYLLANSACRESVEQKLLRADPALTIGRRTDVAVAVVAGPDVCYDPSVFFRAASDSGNNILSMEYFPSCSSCLFTLPTPGLNRFLQELYHVLYRL